MDWVVEFNKTTGHTLLVSLVSLVTAVGFVFLGLFQWRSKAERFLQRIPRHDRTERGQWWSEPLPRYASASCNPP